MYATYLPYTANVSGISLNSSGTVYVTGLADPGPISNVNAPLTTHFPVTTGAFQTPFRAANTVPVTRALSRN